MSSPEESAAKKKLPLAKLAAAAGGLAIAAAIGLQIWGWRNALTDLHRAYDQMTAVVSGAGPTVFFLAAAILPAVGVPNSIFSLSAAPVFGRQLGVPMVVFLAIVALTVNLTLTYWLARRWLRPWLTGLLERFGYRLPQVEAGDMTDLIVLLRVTPGVPLFVQNYLLGLSDAPFVRYMVISCAVQWAYNTAFVLFGDALSHGRGGMAISAVMLLAALVVGTHLVRKHYGKKKAAL